FRRWKQNSKSADVIGSPLWNFTPGRKCTSMIGLSGVPWIDQDSASQFTGLRSLSKRTSCSNIWLMKYLSTPAENRAGSIVVPSAAKATVSVSLEAVCACEGPPASRRPSAATSKGADLRMSFSPRQFLFLWETICAGLAKLVNCRLLIIYMATKNGH